MPVTDQLLWFVHDIIGSHFEIYGAITDHAGLGRLSNILDGGTYAIYPRSGRCPRR